MTDRITAEQARALLDGATEGPWKTRPSYMSEDEIEIFPARVKGKAKPPVGVWSELATVQLDYMGRGKGNARLIAAAPDLAREVIALTADLARVTAERDETREAALAERERCAGICDQIDNECGMEGGLAQACAAAIRAASAEEPKP